MTSRLKALVVDDDSLTLQILDKVLRQSGYEVLTAENGARAWEIYQADLPSLVITDWEMPGLNGIDLCLRIRQFATEGYSYIIFLTIRSGREYLIEGLSAGADDFIAKPVHLDELQVRLRGAERVLALEARLRQANRELLVMNERLLKMSRLDPLMEIGNRLAFEEKFSEYHHKAEQEGRHYAVVMCDVDNFKLCNDSFGHQTGDDVLRQVSAAIRERLRADDAAFRYGGEEILILLSQQDLEGAVAAAERVRRSIEAVEFHGGENTPAFRVTVSCGVVCHPIDPSPAFGRRQLVELADRALYQAKRLGRNCVVGAFESAGEIRFATAQEILRAGPLEVDCRPSEPRHTKVL